MTFLHPICLFLIELRRTLSNYRSHFSRTTTKWHLYFNISHYKLFGPLAVIIVSQFIVHLSNLAFLLFLMRSRYTISVCSWLLVMVEPLLSRTERFRLYESHSILKMSHFLLYRIVKISIVKWRRCHLFLIIFQVYHLRSFWLLLIRIYFLWFYIYILNLLRF